MESQDFAIIVEQLFPVSKERLWLAITELEQMKEWFFDNIPAFEPKLGFKTSFAVRSGERSFTHLWEIIELIPEEKITYHWSYEEYEGEGIVHFELIEKEDDILLRLTNLGLESFPQDLSEFQRESCRGGWKYFIQQRLTEFLK